MTRNSRSTRLPKDVYESALAATALTSRTVAQQIAHWARIGRELETSPQVNDRVITQVLAGSRSYDPLNEQEQAIVRVAWAECVAVLRGELDYEAEFGAKGESYSELGVDCAVVVRPAHGRWHCCSCD